MYVFVWLSAVCAFASYQCLLLHVRVTVCIVGVAEWLVRVVLRVDVRCNGLHVDKLCMVIC